MSDPDPIPPAKQVATLPLAAEDLVVDVAQRVTGTVRVDVRTETVEELARASLSRTDVTVDRRDVDRMLDPGEDPPRVRTEDGVTIVPILEERLVVETRLFLKAELHIATTTLTEEVETPVTLRRQRAEVTRSPAAEQADPHSPQPGEN